MILRYEFNILFYINRPIKSFLPLPDQVDLKIVGILIPIEGLCPSIFIESKCKSRRSLSVTSP